jgi:hypothetical protein
MKYPPQYFKPLIFVQIILTMLAINYKLESFVAPLNAYYSRKNAPDVQLLKIVRSIENMVKNYVQSPHSVQTFANSELDTLFELRLLSLKWLTDNNLVLYDLDNLFEHEFSIMKNDPQWAVLHQNILFALRVNIRSVNSVLESPQSSNAKRRIDFSDLPTIPQLSFSDFLTTISLTAPDAILTPYVDWLIASLYIEFGILTTFVIYKEKIAIDTTKTDALASFIADSAQTFGAITREMKPQNTKKRPSLTGGDFSNSFLSEQTFLAEQDIETYNTL